MAQHLVRASALLDRGCRAAAALFFAAQLLLVLFQVVARYLFQSVPVWTEELARYCMVWGGLLGATVAFHMDLDPKVLQPPRRGPRLWIVATTWVRAAATLIFLGPVLYYSDRFLARTLQRTTEALGISMVWVAVAVPVAVAVIFFHLLARMWSGGGAPPPTTEEHVSENR
jgi:TRAP-type transport system small permease protein